MASEREPVLGIIGGSGLYDIDGLTDTRWQAIDSPFGKPSDEFLFGQIAGKKVVFVRAMDGDTRSRRQRSISAPISML